MLLRVRVDKEVERGSFVVLNCKLTKRGLLNADEIAKATPLAAAHPLGGQSRARNVGRRGRVDDVMAFEVSRGSSVKRI